MLTQHGQGRYPPWVLAAVLALVCMVAFTGCNSGTDPAEVNAPGPTESVPGITGQPDPSKVAFSNEVPSVQELLDVGLSQLQAECFIATLDPDDTGFFTDAERFTVAMSQCFGGSSSE